MASLSVNELKDERRRAFEELSVALEAISVKNLMEFKSQNEVPRPVQSVAVASVCMVARVDDTVEVGPDGLPPRTWEAAQANMAKPGHFVNSLRQFPYAVDSGRMPDVNVYAARQCLESVSPEHLTNEPMALCLHAWVIAAWRYCEVVQMLRLQSSVSGSQVAATTATLAQIATITTGTQSARPKMKSKTDKPSPDRSPRPSLEPVDHLYLLVLEKFRTLSLDEVATKLAERKEIEAKEAAMKKAQEDQEEGARPGSSLSDQSTTASTVEGKKATKAANKAFGAKELGNAAKMDKAHDVDGEGNLDKKAIKKEDETVDKQTKEIDTHGFGCGLNGKKCEEGKKGGEEAKGKAGAKAKAKKAREMQRTSCVSLRNAQRRKIARQATQAAGGLPRNLKRLRAATQSELLREVARRMMPSAPNRPASQLQPVSRSPS